MTIDTEKSQVDRIDGPPPVTSLVRAELPRWAPWGVLVGSFALVGIVLALTGFNVALFVVLGALLYAVATYLLSRFVEGGRKATDRLVTIVVTTAFLIALIPLISVVI